MTAIGHKPNSIRFTLRRSAMPVLEDELATRIEALGSEMREELQQHKGTTLGPDELEASSTMLLEYRELVQQLSEVPAGYGATTFEIHMPTELAVGLVPACLTGAIERLKQAVDGNGKPQELKAQAKAVNAWTKALADLRFLEGEGLENRDL